MDPECARWLAEDARAPGSAAKYGIALGGNWALLWIVMAGAAFVAGQRTAGLMCLAGVAIILPLGFARGRAYAHRVGERAQSYAEASGCDRSTPAVDPTDTTAHR